MLNYFTTTTSKTVIFFLIMFSLQDFTSMLSSKIGLERHDFLSSFLARTQHTDATDAIGCSHFHEALTKFLNQLRTSLLSRDYRIMQSSLALNPI